MKEKEKRPDGSVSRRRAPFTDGGAAAPATMAVDARPTAGEVPSFTNTHGPPSDEPSAAVNIMRPRKPT